MATAIGDFWTPVIRDTAGPGGFRAVHIRGKFIEKSAVLCYAETRCGLSLRDSGCRFPLLFLDLA
jgi:hypothetical protein